MKVASQPVRQILDIISFRTAPGRSGVLSFRTTHLPASSVETRVVSPTNSCTQSVDLRPRSAVSARCGSDGLKKVLVFQKSKTSDFGEFFSFLPPLVGFSKPRAFKPIPIMGKPFFYVER